MQLQIHFFCSMIGVFDSGLWGVQSLLYMRDMLPQYDFLYLGDTAYVPYGERDGQWIHDRTFACLSRLFDQWCALVILACNTASAYALRDWQMKYPHHKVLSVTVPGVEALAAWWFHQPLLLATKATIDTCIYPSVLERAFPEYIVSWHTHVGEWRVAALESDVADEICNHMIENSWIDSFVWIIDCVVLGCTHYPLLRDHIEQVLPGIPLINSAYESAHQLTKYLNRHHDIEAKITKNGKTCYGVTWDSVVFDGLVYNVFGKEVSSSTILL